MKTEEVVSRYRRK